MLRSKEHFDKALMYKRKGGSRDGHRRASNSPNEVKYWRDMKKPWM